MTRVKTALKIRKIHRYLGLFLGIQFLLWTVSGLYFSWTDINEIHGDHFRATTQTPSVFDSLASPTSFAAVKKIRTLELVDIGNVPHYWINGEVLMNAKTGAVRNGISREEAKQVATHHMRSDLKIMEIMRIDSVGNHHEYRGRPLPAYVISYESSENIKAYVSVSNGAFQTLRHRDWRWFDFLWMTHTMDYEGRDDFNTMVLRGFSLLGLITVLSGFVLWYVSSPSLRKLRKPRNNTV